jgi:hypothetical protein
MSPARSSSSQSQSRPRQPLFKPHLNNLSVGNKTVEEIRINDFLGDSHKIE